MDRVPRLRRIRRSAPHRAGFEAIVTHPDAFRHVVCEPNRPPVPHGKDRPDLAFVPGGVLQGYSALLGKETARMRAGTTSSPATNEAAVEYGRLAAELRRAGRGRQQVDIQVAAIALALGRKPGDQ